MGDSSVATSGTRSKKKKGFFKSIGKGVSFKKKKQRPDDESVVGVALETNGGAGGPRTATAAANRPRSVPPSNSYQNALRSNSSGDSSGSVSFAAGGSVVGTAKSIQVVLLLMDPTSRRFELLQLEFDSTKAMVSDVLRQIQASATEQTLRDTSYHGVCDQYGMEMIASMKLSKFCKGNDVVMAMPKGMTGRDTAKLASPILGDPSVGDMLAPCGVKVQHKSAKKGRSAGSAKLTKIAEEDIRRKEGRNKRPTSPKKIARNSGVVGVKESSTKKKKLPTLILGLVISLSVFFTVQRHVQVTRPLESGHVLLPGQWKSQCGIFDMFPPEWLDKLPMDKLSLSCEASSSSMLEFGRDGTLRYFTKIGAVSERKEIWSVAGPVGEEEQCTDEEEDESEQCFDMGATFVKDGNSWYVDMGGSRSILKKDVVRDFMTEN